MATKSRIQIRVDQDTKNKAEKLFKDLGIGLTGAINSFLKQSVREKSIPFKPSLKNNENIQVRNDTLNNENLHSASNIEDLKKQLNEK